jgi:site-specific DNA recombinase
MKSAIRFTGAPASSPYAGRVGLTYSRVSTKGQDGDAQDLRCQQFLASASVPLDRAFADKFTGGGDFLQRPAMREMLDYIDASKGKSFVVVFDDLKRFARDTEFHIRLRHAFRSRDVLLACLNYNFDESPEGRFAEVVIAAQGELERLQNRRQVIQKTKARLERGYWAFSRKKGYDIISTKEHGKFCVANAEGQILAKALEGFASGVLVRPADVHRFLVARKFWSRQNDRKYAEQVSKILRDPFYCGDVEYKPWGVSRRTGKHQALISHATFARIQARLNEGASGKRIRQDVSDDFPHRGLILCASCRKCLTGAHSRGRSKRYPYYYCCNRICPRYAKMFRRDDVAGALSDLIRRNRLRAATSGVVTLLFERSWKVERAEWERPDAEYELEIAKLETDIDEFAILSRATSSNAARRSYETQIEKAAARLAQIDEQRAIYADLEVPFRTALAEAIEFLENPVAAWDSAGSVEKHRLFFFLFEAKLEYDPNSGFRTGNELSTTRLFEDVEGSESQIVHGPRENLNRLKDYLTKFWVAGTAEDATR